MRETFFNTIIEESLSLQIIKETQKYAQKDNIKTLKDCEDYFIENFCLSSSNYHLCDLSRKWRNLLTEKYDYNLEDISSCMSSFILSQRVFPLLEFTYGAPINIDFSEDVRYKAIDLAIREFTKYKYCLDQLSMVYKNIDTNSLSFLDKKNMIIMKNILSKSLYQAESGIDIVEIEIRKLFLFETEIKKQLELSLDAQKQCLINTFDKIKTLDFESDNFKAILIRLEEIVFHKNLYKTFLKKIKNANANHIAIDEKYGNIYIHIINIIHSFLYFEEALNDEINDIAEGLKHIIESLCKSSHLFKISPQINSLSQLKLKINKDQYLDYSCRLYRETFLRDSNLVNYKHLISYIFDKKIKSKLWEMKNINFNYQGFFCGIMYNPILDSKTIIDMLYSKYI